MKCPRCAHANQRRTPVEARRSWSWISLETAKALGLTIPWPLRLPVDQVIE